MERVKRNGGLRPADVAEHRMDKVQLYERFQREATSKGGAVGRLT